MEGITLRVAEAWQRGATAAKELGSASALAGKDVGATTLRLKETAIAAQSALTPAENLKRSQEALATANRDYADALKGKRDAIAFDIKHMNELGLSIEEIGTKHNVNAEHVHRLQRELQNSAKASQTAQKEAGKLAEKLEKQREALEKVGVVTETTVNEALDEMAALTKIATDAGVPLEVVVRKLAPGLLELAEKAEDSGVKSERLAEALDEVTRAARAALKEVTDGVPAAKRGLDTLPGTVVDLSKAMNVSEIQARNTAESFRFFGLQTRDELMATARAAVLHFQEINRSGTATPAQIQAAFERMKDALRAAGIETRDTWKDAFAGIVPALADIRKEISGSLAEMLTGAQSFRDGFIGIWQSIKQTVTRIIADIADYYIRQGLGRMLAATASGGGRGGGLGGALTNYAANNLGGYFAAGGAGAGAGIAGATTTGAVAAGATYGGVTTGLGGAGGAGAGGAGLGGGLALSATTLGVIGIGVALYMWGKHLYNAKKEFKEVNDERDRFIAGFGPSGTGARSGFANLAKQMHAFGAAGDQAFRRLIRADTFEEFNAALAETAQMIGAARTEMQRLAQEGGVAGQALIRFRDATLDTAETQAFIAAQTQTATQAFTAYLQAGAAAYTKLADLRKRYAEADGDERDRLGEEILQQERVVAGTGIKTQAGATATGAALFAAFQARRDQGLPIREALAEMQPAIQAFQAQLEATGFTGGAAFEQIAHFASIASGEITGPALEGIGLLTRGIEALHNAGLLTQEMFAGLTGEVMANRQALIDEGVSAEDANRLMQRDLQTLWQLRKDYNYEVDETTGALLDEAEAAGLVGDQHRSAMDRAAIAMERAALAIERGFRRAGDAADDFGRRVDNAARPRQFTVSGSYDMEDPPEFPGETSGSPSGGGTPTMGPASTAATGGFVTSRGVQRFAFGGLVQSIFGRPKGSDTVPAWLTPGEGVLNLNAMDIIGREGLAALNAGRVAMPSTMGSREGSFAVDVGGISVSVSGVEKNAKEIAAEIVEEVSLLLPKKIEEGGIIRTLWERQVGQMVGGMG
jgi:hypothetical protein